MIEVDVICILHLGLHLTTTTPPPLMMISPLCKPPPTHRSRSRSRSRSKKDRRSASRSAGRYVGLLLLPLLVLLHPRHANIHLTCLLFPCACFVFGINHNRSRSASPPRRGDDDKDDRRSTSRGRDKTNNDEEEGGKKMSQVRREENIRDLSFSATPRHATISSFFLLSFIYYGR